MSNESREYGVARSPVSVFDGLLPLKMRQDIYKSAADASYRIGWADNELLENRQYQNLHADFSADELNKLGLLFCLAPTAVFAHLRGYSMVRAVMNLSTPADVNFAHAHPESKVLLYYVNLDWRAEWYGETLFFGEDLKTIALALPYTPGRIIVFDGAAPHSIRPQSRAAPGFRFTLALMFNPQPVTPPAEGSPIPPSENKGKP